MHADSLAAQLVRQVTAARFESGLHRPHHVVARHDLVGAVVTHREQRSAVLHQWGGEPRHAHERVTGDVHGLLEAFGGAVDERSAQILLRRERDRVEHDVEPAPLLGDSFEHRLQHAGRSDVERHEDRRLQLSCQRLDVGPGLLVDVGDRQICAQLAKRLRAAVSDRMLVGDSDDECFRARERGPWNVEGHDSNLRLT